MADQTEGISKSAFTIQTETIARDVLNWLMGQVASMDRPVHELLNEVGTRHRDTLTKLANSQRHVKDLLAHVDHLRALFDQEFLKRNQAEAKHAQAEKKLQRIAAIATTRQKKVPTR